jgi:tetratricopeptide (TPR) repeat protein
MSVSRLREKIFNLLYSEKKTEHAILQLNSIIKSSPENSEALALKAYTLNKLANTRRDWKYTKKALEYANRALQLNPDDDIALTSKGWALIDLGKAHEAIQALVHATRANPKNEYAWYNLAWAQYLTGKTVESTESITRALAINPGNPIIKKGKRMMENGQVPVHLRKKPTYVA